MKITKTITIYTELDILIEDILIEQELRSTSELVDIVLELPEKKALQFVRDIDKYSTLFSMKLQGDTVEQMYDLEDTKFYGPLGIEITLKIKDND